jgi:ABC-type dipeptide/oligopeptide/nickel transport system permease component/ABC-type dipeptide/oligopeptide/nickel transport system permease subunit
MSELLSEEEMAQSPRGPDEPAPMPSTERRERLAAWLQFPRRVVLLLIALVLALLLIRALRGPLLAAGMPEDLARDPDWSVSWLAKRPVGEMVGERLPNTLILLGAATLVALLFALVAALVAVLVHKLEERTGPLGSILKGLGRLWVFGNAAMPVFGTAMFLILVYAVKFKEWGLPSLPMGGMYTITPDNRYKYDLLDRLQHLVPPSFALALLPAALTAQAMARELTLPRERGGFRLWLSGLFKGLGTLLGQAGGWLSAVVLIETTFSWPGIGRLALDAVYRQDLPVVLGILSACAVLVLIGRLGAELFCWLERLVQVPPISPQPEPNRWRKTARTVWVVAALALLLIPLGVAVAGLTVDRDKVLQTDLGGRLAPPSAEHPWGTDNLGRDVKARVLRGGLITLGTVVLLVAAILLPSALGGTLAGFLASRRALWAESLADLLLLPADVLLCIPALPGAILASLMLGREQAVFRSVGSSLPSWIGVGLVCALVLLPRAVRTYQALWIVAPERKRGLVLGLAGTGALLLGTAYAGFGLITSLEFLGLGTRPPLPTLGGLATPGMLLGGGLVAIVALWACSLSLYVAADALIGFFGSKEVLARLNE